MEVTDILSPSPNGSRPAPAGGPGASAGGEACSVLPERHDVITVCHEVADLEGIMRWYGRHRAEAGARGRPRGKAAAHLLREGPRWAECVRCNQRLEVTAGEAICEI
jgi:hypothetical protein